MKKSYVDPERLTDYVIEKFDGKADLKNEIKVEEHDDLCDNIYNNEVSQSTFLYVEYFLIRTFSIDIESSVMTIKNNSLLNKPHPEVDKSESPLSK